MCRWWICVTALFLCFVARAQQNYNADSVEQIFKFLPDSLKIREANNLMKFYLDVDFAKTIYYAQQAFALEAKVTNRKDVATSYISWAIAQYNFGKYDEALSYNLMFAGQKPKPT